MVATLTPASMDWWGAATPWVQAESGPAVASVGRTTASSVFGHTIARWRAEAARHGRGGVEEGRTSS